VDIYLSGSNAHLLSSELATLLSGRYVEFPVYGLSFDEFRMFAKAQEQDPYSVLTTYLRFGGFPGIHMFDLSQSPESVAQYQRSIYDTILLKDIVGRNHVRNVSHLEMVMKFVFRNIGHIVSARRIADFLASQRLKVSVEAILDYLGHAVSAYALHRVQRYDVRGKRVMEVYDKYFLGDTSLLTAQTGFRQDDLPGILENVVFLELKRRGYGVFLGKAGDAEIDFIATAQDRVQYVQVAYLLASPETVEREVAPLRNLRDHHPKYILTMDATPATSIDGIRRMHVADFLLGKTA
jgi:predicted AAA+ superfamily ATPase